jgi:hypothetical protein
VSDYEKLVRELVNELNLMCDRFNEYRVNTVQEVMNIMSEAKREEMGIIVNSMDVNKYIKQQASNSIAQEEALQKYKTENFELKSTLMKMRSMYNLKETALRSSFDKKVLLLETKTSAQKTRRGKQVGGRKTVGLLSRIRRTRNSTTKTAQRNAKESDYF